MNKTIALEPATASNLQLRAQDTLSRMKVAAMLPLAFSALIGLGVVLELRGMDVRQIAALVPRSATFWSVFAVFYVTGPLSEWFIYRRLWSVPAGCLLALLRKLVCNELLLGYLGEAYFYSWARRRTQMSAAPFGAIKDVSILSAMVGNAVTLVLLIATWPFIRSTPLALENGSVVLSLSVVLATSIGLMALRHRIFTLDPGELRFIAMTHLARIVITTMLSALLWHMVLSAVPLIWWLLLATLRLLISRLPLVPNKDIVFAGVAVLALGRETNIAALMTMMASAILLVHLTIGAVLVLYDLLRPEDQR